MWVHAPGALGARCVAHANDRPIGKGFDQYFTQTLLTDYMANHPEETLGWNVVFDARGHFNEPHTVEEVPLGTLQVRKYLARVHPSAGSRPKTKRPSLRRCTCSASRHAREQYWVSIRLPHTGQFIARVHMFPFAVASGPSHRPVYDTVRPGTVNRVTPAQPTCRTTGRRRRAWSRLRCSRGRKPTRCSARETGRQSRAKAASFRSRASLYAASRDIARRTLPTLRL